MVGVNATVSQKRPVGSLGVNGIQIHLCHNDFFLINRATVKDLSGRICDKALPPKLDAVSSVRCLVTDSVWGHHVTAVGNGVATLHGFPSTVLSNAVLRFFAGMPTYGSRVEQDLRPV
jgi:hypothetical protein